MYTRVSDSRREDCVLSVGKKKKVAQAVRYLSTAASTACLRAARRSGGACGVHKLVCAIASIHVELVPAVSFLEDRDARVHSVVVPPVYYFIFFLLKNTHYVTLHFTFGFSVFLLLFFFFLNHIKSNLWSRELSVVLLLYIFFSPVHTRRRHRTRVCPVDTVDYQLQTRRTEQVNLPFLHA